MHPPPRILRRRDDYARRRWAAHKARPHTTRLLVSLAILLLAALLSANALGHARRWHPDEAFYMSFAHHAAVKGDWWLLSEPVDKPPLTFYLNALALQFFAVDVDSGGVLFLDVHKGEFAGRLPSWFASVLLVAAVMAWAQALSGRNHVAWLAGVLVALSPLRIVFAPTAFTDMPMLLLATLSLWQAARGHPAWAGVWFVLSIAAKPQSIFLLPLVVALLITIKPQISPRAQQAAGHARSRQAVPGTQPRLWGEAAGGQAWRRKALWRFVLPMLVGVGLLLLWDVMREAQGAVNVWALGRANYPPLQQTPLAAYGERFTLWWETVQWLFGSGALTVALLGAGCALVIRTASGQRLWRARRQEEAGRANDSDAARLRVLLPLWLLTFFALHMALTLNLYDRNMLVLLPVAGLWVAWELAPLLERSRWLRAVGAAGLLLLVALGWQASTGVLRIGGDTGWHDGIDDFAAYLNSKPVATVIYDPWLNWELNYYMGSWSDKRRVHYPTPEELVAGALALDERGTRYFVAPTNRDAAPWLDALAGAGFTVTLDEQLGNFRSYALRPPE